MLGVIVFLVSDLKSTFAKVGESESLQHQIYIAENLSLLIHELQKERGMSAGYLASNRAKFVNELKAQRKLTDENIARVLEITSNLNDLSPSYVALLGESRNAINQIATIRANADNPNNTTQATLPPTLAYFTGTIAKMLGSIVESTKLITDSAIQREMYSYVNFLYAKEMSGLERATGNGIFAANTPASNDMYNRFVGLITQQEVYLKYFLDFGAESSKNFFSQTAKDESFKSVEKMREILISKHTLGNYGVEPTIWFGTITKKLIC